MNIVKCHFFKLHNVRERLALQPIQGLQLWRIVEPSQLIVYLGSEFGRGHHNDTAIDTWLISVFLDGSQKPRRMASSASKEASCRA